MMTTDWGHTLRAPPDIGDAGQLQVGSSRLTVFHLKVPAGSAEVARFVRELIDELAQLGRIAQVVEPFDPRAASWLGRIRSSRLVDRLRRVSNLSRETALSVLNSCNVSSAQKAELIPWTERVLIALELAARTADLVIIHAARVDGSGEPRLLARLQQHIDNGLAVLALEYPLVHGPLYSVKREA